MYTSSIFSHLVQPLTILNDGAATAECPSVLIG